MDIRPRASEIRGPGRPKISGPILKVESISLDFGSVRALSHVSLELYGDEILALIGPNGAGKTCVLNCINGFYSPTGGSIFFNDQDISGLSPSKRAKIGISRTFQNIELYTGLTALENLMAARHAYLKYGAMAGAFFFGRARREEVRNRRIVEEIIDLLEMTEVRHKVIESLAFGIRKRVDLGRALSLEPKVLLLDEPSLGLAPLMMQKIFQIVKQMNEESNIAILLVEQNALAALEIASYSYVMENGRIVMDDLAEKLKENEDIKEFYLGLSKIGIRKSYKDVKHYKRRKRWLS